MTPVQANKKKKD